MVMQSNNGSIHPAILALLLTSSTNKYNNPSLQSNLVTNPSVAMAHTFIPAGLEWSSSKAGLIWAGISAKGTCVVGVSLEVPKPREAPQPPEPPP
eukprot:13149431-Ditylum_brightwellii.AAC.1